MASVPHGFMTDSNINPHSGDGATSTGVSYALTTAGGRPAIRMTLDTAWLDARSRVFPVTVDPSVGSYNSNGTTYVESTGSGDYSGDTEIHVGTYDGGTNVAKSFLKFGSVSSSLTNDTVLGRPAGRVQLLVLQLLAADGGGVPGHLVLVGRPGTSPTRARRPAAAIGTKSFATGWVPLGSTVSPCPAAWEGIQPERGRARSWSTAGRTARRRTTAWPWARRPPTATGGRSSPRSTPPTGTRSCRSPTPPTGPATSLASSQPVQQVSPTQNGEIAIKVTNTGLGHLDPDQRLRAVLRGRTTPRASWSASHPVFTPMPSTVAPGASVTVDAKVNELPVGSYAIDFDMYANATTLLAGVVPVRRASRRSRSGCTCRSRRRW